MTQAGSMQAKLDDKHKVTVYLPPELHRQLKVQAAVEEETMSVLVERAIAFYLAHPDLVEERLGQTHRLYHCPACTTSVVLRGGELTALSNPKDMILEDDLRVPVRDAVLSLR
jgi:Ribbon-helix-helix protein, copG family